MNGLVHSSCSKYTEHFIEGLNFCLHWCVEGLEWCLSPDKHLYNKFMAKCVMIIIWDLKKKSCPFLLFNINSSQYKQILSPLVVIPMCV